MRNVEGELRLLSNVAASVTVHGDDPNSPLGFFYLQKNAKK